MLPFLLAVVGGYLIGDSMKTPTFDEGGDIDVEDFYENIQVHVQGVGTIYQGKSLREATKVFDEYYANHPHAEIVMVDEKYGEELKWGNYSQDDDDDYEELENDLRSEYESTYLAYVKGNDYLEFDQWLKEYKKMADGGMMAKGGGTEKWTLKPNGRYYRTFVVDSKDYREITEHGVTESMEQLDNGKYEIVISVTEKGKEYFEKNMGNKYADGGMMAKGGLFGDSRYNYGRSWKLDHNRHNKGQSYEIPMRKRKRK